QVEAVQVHELLADLQAQPQEEGQARVGAVRRELAADGEVGVLDAGGGGDAALQPPVQAPPGHPLQPAAVALDQGSQGGLVAVAGGVQQFLVGSGGGGRGHNPGALCSSV